MDLRTFIKQLNFPCIMARAVASNGHLQELHLENGEGENLHKILKELYLFINHYRTHPKTLHSFTLSFKAIKYQDFHYFEYAFWEILKNLSHEDKKKYNHDPRVSADPTNPHFSYSLMEESFFILTLHPQSPRFSRRFKAPTIVFNPHQQFEELRHAGRYQKIRDTIRHRDKLLQGDVNPMLSDFGEDSEIYQYMGRSYAADEKINFLT